MDICTKEQEDAVNMIAENVAMIKVSGQNQEEGEDIMNDDMMISFPISTNADQGINAAEYKMKRLE